MRPDSLTPFGSGGGTVEIDETYIGVEPSRYKTKRPKRPGGHDKMKVVTLIDRARGMSRSFVVDKVSKTHIYPILRENIDREARIMTDEAGIYRGLDKVFASHDSVNHYAGEYGRGEIHTNTVEGFYSVFKRGMKGVYQHCGKQHLHRYVAEFDFRYSNRAALDVNDTERAARIIQGAEGKRLTYRRSDARPGA